MMVVLRLGLADACQCVPLVFSGLLLLGDLVSSSFSPRTVKSLLVAYAVKNPESGAPMMNGESQSSPGTFWALTSSAVELSLTSHLMLAAAQSGYYTNTLYLSV